MDQAQLRAALAEWAAVIGNAHVTADPYLLERTNRATLFHDARNLAVIEPGNETEVAACLRIAARHHIPLHAVSRGRNWGYGSRLPRIDSALLSLKRLNGIFRDDGLAIIEPGVTFAALAEATAGTPYLSPQIGAGGATSVLGNLLQRGLAKPPYADMPTHLECADILSREGNPSKIRSVDHLPEGAVVTRAAVRLLRAPALRQLAWAILRDDSALGALIDAARPLLDHRDDRLQLEAINGARCLIQSPPGEPPPAAPGEWIAGFTLWGDDAAEIETRRAGIPLALTLGPLEPGNALPGNDEGLRSAYWAKGAMSADPDPDRDRCGVAWFVPALPLDGGEVEQSVTMAQAVLRAYGFPPAVSVRSGHDGRVKAVIGIFFDRDRPGADGRARACHDALAGQFAARGHAPYRRSVWTA